VRVHVIWGGAWIEARDGTGGVGSFPISYFLFFFFRSAATRGRRWEDVEAGPTLSFFIPDLAWLFHFRHVASTFFACCLPTPAHRMPSSLFFFLKECCLSQEAKTR
jgi:hypothetical protein